MKINIDELLAIPVPPKTRTFEPIPYETIIYGIKKAIKGFTIESVDIDSTRDGGIISGHFDIRRKKDPSTTRLLFESSYSKQIRTRIGAGIVLGNFNGSRGSLFFHEAFTTDMRHRGGVLEYFPGYLEKVREALSNYPGDALEALTYIRSLQLDGEDCANILGHLFFNKIVTGQQLKIIRSKIFRCPGDNNVRNMGTVLLEISRGLEISHPIKKIESYKNLMDHIYNKYI